MYQRLLVSITCTKCGGKYSETGYWRDAEFCPACSMNERRLEEEKKKDLARRAAEITEKYGLDLDKYPSDIPEEVRKQLNPRNAGRKSVKYEDAYCELLVEMAAEGKPEVEFAAVMRISQSLITHWTEKHPRFKKAREVANEVREAWFEKHFIYGMLQKIPVNATMMIRYGAAHYGWGDKTENVVKGTGELPVVKFVERDAGFPTETLAPSKEQVAEAGLQAG